MGKHVRELKRLSVTIRADQDRRLREAQAAASDLFLSATVRRIFDQWFAAQALEAQAQAQAQAGAGSDE